MSKAVPHTERTCLNCGWVHFAITREEAIAQMEEFNRWLSNQPTEVQKNYAMPRDPRKCFCCQGSYKNFRASKPNDAPLGCTLQGIVID